MCCLNLLGILLLVVVMSMGKRVLLLRVLDVELYVVGKWKWYDYAWVLKKRKSCGKKNNGTKGVKNQNSR